MTAEERKFERARKGSIGWWKKLLLASLGYKFNSEGDCGFCKEYDCVNCPMIIDDNTCYSLSYGFDHCFTEDKFTLRCLTVLIGLHHMATNFVTVEGDPLDELLIEWVEV